MLSTIFGVLVLLTWISFGYILIMTAVDFVIFLARRLFRRKTQ